MSNPLLPARTTRTSRGTAAALLRGRDDRERRMADGPWEAVTVGRPPLVRHLAVHAASGRQYRLDVASAGEAQAQVDLLNRASLSITA